MLNPMKEVPATLVCVRGAPVCLFGTWWVQNEIPPGSQPQIERLLNVASNTTDIVGYLDDFKVDYRYLFLNTSPSPNQKPL